MFKVCTLPLTVFEGGLWVGSRLEGMDIFVVFVVIGGIAFGLFSILFEIKIRKPALGNNKTIESIESFLTILMLICIAVVVISVFIGWQSQPSAYEQCVSADDLSDPAAIAWIEEYCASIHSR